MNSAVPAAAENFPGEEVSSDAAFRLTGIRTDLANALNSNSEAEQSLLCSRLADLSPRIRQALSGLNSTTDRAVMANSPLLIESLRSFESGLDELAYLRIVDSLAKYEQGTDRYVDWTMEENEPIPLSADQLASEDEQESSSEPGLDPGIAFCTLIPSVVAGVGDSLDMLEDSLQC